MVLKIVLITGCSKGGIGYYLAKEFSSRKDYIVVGTARNPETTEFHVLTDCNMSLEDNLTNLYSCSLDVTSEESMTKAVRLIMQRFGRIDVLINNAGVSVVGPICEISVERVKAMYEVNVFGLLRLCQIVFPHLVKSKGRIINIGSIAGDVSTPFGGTYSSSKAALKLVTDSLRMECKPFGIQVMLVKPGAIKSNIGKQNLTSLSGSSWKWYAPYESFINMRAMSSQSSHSTATDIFARQVVDLIQFSRWMPAHVAIGHLTWTFFWLRTLIPFSISDFFLGRKFGLK